MTRTPDGRSEPALERRTAYTEALARGSMPMTQITYPVVVAGTVVSLLWRHAALGIALCVLCPSAILDVIRRGRGGGLGRPKDFQ